jgi:endo-1,4-beta-D-glucanase Y
MRRKFPALLIYLCIGLMMPFATPANAASSIAAADWQAYKARFVDTSGRIIDDANGNISHSEGQGYGLLLSYLAGQPSDFDLIWSFTRTGLMLRDDGLAVWKWDPATKPHVTDANNATDGDLLIAYALALAGTAWSRPDLAKAAAGIADAVGKKTIEENQGRKLMMPAVTGFHGGDRPDAPVVNLSYWVFEAFPVLAKMAPETDWQRISDDGMALVAAGRLGPRKMPPDWLSLMARPKPAKGFPAEFGYNAVRIPLYLLRAGNRDPEMLNPFREGMMAADGSVELTDIATGEVRHTLSDPGYRIIPALISCVLDGTKLPENLRSFAPTLYYPSTLHLLGLSFANSEHPECMQ